MGLDAMAMTMFYVNKECADQPLRPRRLISAFVIFSLQNVISKLVYYMILTFQLVFVAEQAGLNLTWSEIPKTGLEVIQLIFHAQLK